MSTRRKTAGAAAGALAVLASGPALWARPGEEPRASWEPAGDGRDLSVPSLAPASGRRARVARRVRWAWRGEAVFSRKGDLDVETAWKEQVEAGPRAPAMPDRRPPAARSHDRWVALHLASGHEYTVELPRSVLDRLRAAAAAARLDRGSADGAIPRSGRREIGDAAPGTRGWSNADDGRTRRFNNTAFPFRAMGQINGGLTSGCSGTLIGPRHIITAAHCLWNVQSDSWASGFRFRPGREGTCDAASCEPYGEYTARWYFTPEEFRETEQWRYDYGIVVTWGRPGDLTGWLGYVAINQDTTRDYCDLVPFGPGYLGGLCANRGYPACGFVENASLSGGNCRQGWAYQDVSPCEIGSFSDTGPDGWKSRFSTSCDIGRGHSGSAVYIDGWNGSGKVVIGVASTQSCATCSSGDDYPNGIRRVTPDVLSWIAYFKSVFP